MSAKRTILLIIAAFAALSAAAQARLVFEPDTWDFGTIRESDGRVSHTFTGVNRGDKPLVILDVVTSCGCTAPEFSRRPVTPGGTTQITVTYDPTNRPGTFTKELWIYSDERKKIASITVQGNVTPREKSLEELYPVDAGGGLRLAATLSACSYIYQGRQTQGAIGYANASDRTIRLSLRPQSASGLLSIDAPQRIAPGQRGEINLSYLIPADKPRYGTLRDALEVAGEACGPAPEAVVHALEHGRSRTDRPGRGGRRTHRHDARTGPDGGSGRFLPGRGAPRPRDAGFRRPDRAPRGGDQRPRAADAAAADHGDHRRVTHKRLIRHNVPHS